MFSFVKQTLMRGRSFVPLIFLRTRQRRSRASFCFCQFSSSMLPRIWPWRFNSLLNGLAFLAVDVFADIAHTLALVRFRRIEAADLRGHLADHLPVRALQWSAWCFLPP